MNAMSAMISIDWMRLEFPLAQAAENSIPGTSLLLYHLASVALFSVVGIVVLVVCLLLMEWLTPYSIVKEIIDEHNVALAIVMASVVLGMAVIIAASVVG